MKLTVRVMYNQFLNQFKPIANLKRKKFENTVCVSHFNSFK